MANLDRRIGALEQHAGVGTREIRTITVCYEKLEDFESALTDAIARDEAERGPLPPDGTRLVVTFGPGGQWVDTPQGLRWRYRDGTLGHRPGETPRDARTMN